MLASPGAKRRSGMLWLSGVSRLTVPLSPQFDSLSIQSKPLVNARRMIRGEENYASRFIESMCQKEPQLKMAQQLSLDFYRMLKTKNKSQLNQWFSDVSQSGLIDLQRVAAGMEADATAIHEAISSRWSNGVVEGHVNRLKMLKRQMYGRAGFELLRRRVMSPLA